MLLSKACDIKGIVAVACARHGCFAPNSLSDLQAGEGQPEMDHTNLKAMQTTNMEELKCLFLIYDIMCQYWVHFQECMKDMLPEHIKVIERAIGLLHVHGHKINCFFCYATSFIPGAGVVAGEILESLWSVLNTVAPMTRTATLAHHAEILDDHMNDCNWKKIQDMGKISCIIQLF